LEARLKKGNPIPEEMRKTRIRGYYAPADPSRYGYTFTGGNLEDFTITAEADINVSAQ